MPNHQDPRLHFAAQQTPPARPDEPTPPEDATFRLGAPEPVPAPAPAPTPTPDTDPTGPEDATFRLDGPAFGPHADEPTRATMLDPDSWSSEAPYAVSPPAPAPVAAPVPVPELDRTVPQPPDDGTAPSVTAPPASTSASATAAGAVDTGGLRRFGPGVPGPDTSGTSMTAAVWHGTLRPGAVPPAGAGKRRRRALRGWLLAVLVLLAVLAYLAWQRFPASVKVDGASVRNATAVQGCHSTARVVGTLRTSGGAGTVRYRWRRSDGTVSDELKQHIAKGSHHTDVVLLWTFDGPGSLTATATLEVLGPQHVSASGSFAYRCAG